MSSDRLTSGATNVCGEWEAAIGSAMADSIDIAILKRTTPIMPEHQPMEIIRVVNGVIVRPAYRPEREGMLLQPDNETYVFTTPQALQKFLFERFFDVEQVLQTMAQESDGADS